ncbi:MAG: hypothetical protein ACWGOX_09535, partial [Desulforhopalus sp.]
MTALMFTLYYQRLEGVFIGRMTPPPLSDAVGIIIASYGVFPIQQEGVLCAIETETFEVIFL